MRAANSPNYVAFLPFNTLLLSLRENKFQSLKKTNTKRFYAVCLMAFTGVSGHIYNFILKVDHVVAFTVGRDFI